MIPRNSWSLGCRCFRLSLLLFPMLLIAAPQAVPRHSDDAQQPRGDTAQSEELPLLSVPQRSQAVDEWGEITIAQPKVWQYERVTALLDGLLRDVEGVSLTDLTRLDPSSPNAAAVRFVQSALGIAVQYDQAAQVNNANILQTWQAQHDVQVAQLQQYNQYVTTLNQQRSQITTQLLAAETTVVTLQGQTDANGHLSPDQQRQLVDAQNRVTALKSQLGDVNSMITSAGAAPTLTAPPSPQGTSASSLQPNQPALSSFADILKGLPDGVQKGLTSALQSPSYPASKQLDNFITLLHERMAREISVQQDDLMRDPENLAFLLQFDVGLYPSKKTKNHMARVEFELTNCPGCKIYSLYPGQSAYNVANYQGASHRRSFVGNLMTLIGLGITASYQRQEDALQGSLVQSVYISGFEDDMNSAPRRDENVAQRFGWYYNAAPFDQYVTPGIRSTFALITVPREVARCFQQRNLGTMDSECAQIRDVSKMANVTARDKETASPRKHPAKISSREPGRTADDTSLVYISGSGSDGVLSDSEISATNKEEPAHPELKVRLPKPFAVSLNVEADWARRDNPLYQNSGWFSKRYLGEKHKTGVQRTLRVELPGTNDLTALSPSLIADKQRLHVLRMEYNTVTSKKVNPDPSPSPTASPAATPALTQTSPDLCSKRECATVLLSLDVPIDPNLVVTVHGTVLPRVRDWRGRATSVMPPAQSQSDLVSGGSALQLKTQTPLSRSLLESDQLQPNSWFAVTSHDLLLNISHHLAGEEEFPVIQLSLPGKQTLVIPNDLQENTTELITDGFRFLPPAHVKPHVSRIFGLSPAVGGLNREPQAFGGPFPYATFMPLFQPDPAARRFYAVVGETRKDLIVGFIREPQDASKPGHSSFLETRTLAILEDPDLDLAWPLPCEKQGEELICHLPVSAISEGYKEVKAACLQEGKQDGHPSNEACPTIQSRISHFPSFISGLQLWVEQYDPDGDNAFWSPEPVKIGVLPISEKDFPERGAEIDYRGTRIYSAGFKPWHFDGFHTTPESVALEECNYFGQLQATISYLTPIDFVDPQNHTSHIELQPSGHKDDCQYITLPTASLLGPEIILQMKPENAPSWTADIPTPQLRPEFGHPSVVPSFEERAGGFGIKSWTVSTQVTRMHYKDRLQEEEELKQLGMSVDWHNGNRVFNPNTCTDACLETWWPEQQAGQIQLQLTIPKSAALRLPLVLHLIRTEPPRSSSPRVEPETGTNIRSSDPAKEENVQRPQKEDRKPQTRIAPSRPANDGINVTVAVLSHLRDLLLPTKLRLETLGDNQFALRGTNAGAIDAVGLQSAGKTLIYSAGSAGDFAVIDTTPPPAPKAPSATPPTVKGKARGKARQGALPAQPANSPANSATTQDGNSANSGSALPPGTYAVLPLVRDTRTNTYLPIQVTDDTGAPLVFTKKATAKSADGQPSSTDETITITRTVAKPQPGK